MRELSNGQAERAVLGACMLSRESLLTTAKILKPDDFYDTPNRIAYNIML